MVRIIIIFRVFLYFNVCILLCNVRYGMADIGWSTYMSYELYNWIVNKNHPDKISKNIPRAFIAILILTGLLALILLIIGVYSIADGWCWIDTEYTQLRFYCFYLWLLVSWVGMIFILYSVSKLFKRSQLELSQSNMNQNISNRSAIMNSISTMSFNNLVDVATSEKTIQLKLKFYIGIFVFTWFFGLLNRFVSYLYNRPVFITAILESLFVPLQGYLNSIVYSSYFNKVLLKTSTPSTKKSFFRSIIDLKYEDIVIDESTSTIPSFKPDNYVSKQYSIFSTTLNFGESTYENLILEINSWIVHGHDIYVICFQECIDFEKLKQIILEHLGGSSEYTVFSNEIGSSSRSLGYHGYIGIFVYVRTHDIVEGHIAPTIAVNNTLASGTNLLWTKAQNKGAVGLTFQIYDTSIGFISCHLPSDSKGKSKLYKRNLSAQSILKDLNLIPEDNGFDIQFQHDHLLVLGDLNYRMETDLMNGPHNLLYKVIQACSIEKDALLNTSTVLTSVSSWLELKYNLLRELNDRLYPSISHQQLLLLAKFQSYHAWSSILSIDELRTIMEVNDAFYKFYEPLPMFPPSYKRVKGYYGGDCGDYTDINTVIKGYSNLGLTSEDSLSLSSSSTVFNNDNVSGKKRLRNRSFFKFFDHPIDEISNLDEDTSDVRFSNIYEDTEPAAATGSPSRALDVDTSVATKTTNHPLQFHTTINSSRSSSESIADFKNNLSHKVKINNVDKVLKFSDSKVAPRIYSMPLSRRGDPRFNPAAMEGSEDESIATINTQDNANSKHKNNQMMRQVKNKSDSSISSNTNQANDEASKKLRPPSYTDRILVHSLDDRRDKLIIQAYDMCDTIRVSDHRPVCMTMRLEVFCLTSTTLACNVLTFDLLGKLYCSFSREFEFRR